MAKEYTLNEVMQALRNADAAGDKEGAARLAQIASGMASTQQPNLTAGEVAKQAVTNLPSSFGGLITDLYTAVTNPIQTAKSVIDLGAGMLQAALPESVVQFVGEDKASRDVARKVGQFYVDRYGSVESAKKAVAQDPAGVLADVATVLYGGGALTPGRAGSAITKAGSMVDPLSLAAKGAAATVGGAGRVVAPVLGMTTGAGGESISQAYRAGREGGERATQFRENITGRADPEMVLEAAKQNLAVFRQNRADAYRSGMFDVKRDKTQLSFDGIDSAIAKAEARTKYGDKVTDKAAFDAVQEVKDRVAEWKSADPAVYHTPEGMDALKQTIGATLDKLEFNKNPYTTVNQIYNSVKTEITKQAPTYANTMRGYTQATEQIREIEKALSLGNKASVDTAVRKLQSLMRDNVNTNYGQRVKLAKQLEEQGGNLMMPGIAGQALQSKVPRGLAQLSGGGLGGYFALAGEPVSAVTALGVASPRLMGEAAYGAGVIGRKSGQVAQQAPFILNPELYNLLYQSGQVQGLLGE